MKYPNLFLFGILVFFVILYNVRYSAPRRLAWDPLEEAYPAVGIYCVI